MKADTAEASPSGEMNADQLQSDMATIKEVLSTSESQRNPHRKIIKIANLVFGILTLIATPFSALAYKNAQESFVELAHYFGNMVHISIALGFVFAAIYLLAAWGVHKKKQWGVKMAVVSGVLSIPSVPIGTALGIYTFWAAAKRKLA